MDVAQMSAAVYKKTGVAIGLGDPAFALVELNRLILDRAIEEAGDQIAERLGALPERIRSSGTSVAAEVASQGVQRVAEMLAESRRTIASDTEQAQRRIAEQIAKSSETLGRQVAAVARTAEMVSRGGAFRVRCLLAAAVVGVASCTAGFVGGEFAAAHDTVRPPTGR